jgi:glycosyltransferase involved in cell wall biosynthesis
MKIAFLFGPLLHAKRDLHWHELWTDERGLTGSEVACVAFAQEMAERGHAVTFFAPQDGQGEYRLPSHVATVKTDHLELFPRRAGEFDAVYAWCEPDLLRPADPRSVRLCNQQLNDFRYMKAGYDEAVDVWTFPSKTHAEYMKTRAEISALGGMDFGKWRVLPNGCYPDEYTWANVERVPGRCVYSSSPDRGLHLLLQEWPHIRKAVPGASLKIFYFALMRWLEGSRAQPGEPAEVHAGIQEHRKRARYVEMAIARADRLGIEVVGGVSRRELARELSRAQVLCYPTATLAWSEGFSCATLEGCASGALPVISECDALGEIYGGAVPMVKAPAVEHMLEWRGYVIQALTEPVWRGDWVAKARALAVKHAWPRLAEKLEGIVEDARTKKHAPASVTTVEPGRTMALHMTLTPAACLPARVLHVEDMGKDDCGGGARAGFVGLARAIADVGRLNYRVRAYCPVPEETVVDGVEWVPISRYRTDKDKPDVLLSYFDFSTLTERTGMLRIASHHSCSPYPGAPYDWADLNVAPSRWAVEWLRRTAPEEKWAVLPNGLAPFELERKPVKGRVLHHAPPSRGLHLLLEAWPEIARRVPGASLHVIGPLDEWMSGHYGQHALRTSAQGRRIARIRAALPLAMEAGGVEILGQVSRSRMLREFSEAACCASPTSMCYPSETFSISCLEVLTAGIPLVLAPADAFAELWSDYALMVPELPANPELLHLGPFIDDVCAVLLDDAIAAEWSARGKKVRGKYTFEKAAEILDGLIRENLR